MPAEEAAARAPGAAYRVQLNSGFTLDDAAGIADYLAELGVTHLYTSPLQKAARGSSHGYDVVDHGRVNEELGGAPALSRLKEALGRHGLGQVLDIVPNHMAITRDNVWWWDVLENGPLSRYANHFDVDWDPPESKLRNTVLLPVLGDHYGRVLEAGEIKLERQGGSFIVRYHEHQAPVAPDTLPAILQSAAERCGSESLAFLADAFGWLPASAPRDRPGILRRHRDKEALRGMLERLCREDRRVGEALDQVVAEMNASPDALDSLLDRQNYRLAFWRTAGQELDYRRFFDINSLAGLSIEDRQVLLSTHALVAEWVKDGTLDGLRIDHPDGLRDPEQYLSRLRELVPDAWIVVEKVLEPGEALRRTWPVAGTTGYEFLSRLGGLFVDPRGEGPLTETYREFTGESADFPAVVREKKLLVLRQVLASDVNRLSSLFVRVCERHRRWRDYTRRELTEALREVIACFPVYRTYVRAEAGQAGEEDARCLNEAVEAARASRPDLDGQLFDFFRDILLLKVRGPLESELVMRFQQLSGPAMAKGVEDTAFYTFNRLVSLNEVGGDPGRFGVSLDEFHRASAEAMERWPLGMTTTATHDTKRGEDVRARLALLSEVPQRWAQAARRWSAMNERHRRNGFPDRNAEYLFYQTLVGAWPLGADRAAAYMEKASREAKVHTSWTDPRPEYEQALAAFVEETLGDEEFTADLARFVEPLVTPGRINSLSQTLIKLTAPGVPDIYQGAELWSLTLVDPDNRRPVDYALRRRLLADLAGASPEEVWKRIDEGLPKLWVIHHALKLRRRRPELFGARGGYRPVEVRGRKAAHVVAFSRGDGAVAVAPRLVLGLGGDWGDTSIDLGSAGGAGARWVNRLTGDEARGGRVRLDRLLARFPVALLAKDA